MEFVIQAKAGIQLFQNVLDPGVRRGDDWKDFLQNPQISCRPFLNPSGLMPRVDFPL